MDKSVYDVGCFGLGFGLNYNPKYSFVNCIIQFYWLANLDPHNLLLSFLLSLLHTKEMPELLTWALLLDNQHQSGIFVHPSGVEKHLHECVDVLDKSYGCKQDCRIWVDQISSAQIGSDIWLVKFHKWELSGDVLQLCCLCCCKYLISELILELLHSSIAPMIPNIFFKKLNLNVYCPDKCYAGMYQGGERHCCLTTVLLNAEVYDCTFVS